MGLSADARRQLGERFWSKVTCGTPAACWLCTLSAHVHGGHGQFTYRFSDKQVVYLAHRVAWLLATGTTAGELKVCHRCDVPLCCNPRHLFLGTQADNLNDARDKGRLVDGLGARKLSDDAYRDILNSSHAYGTGQALAAKYGVTIVTISRIRHGRQGVTFHNAQRVEQAAQTLRVPVQLVPRDRDVAHRALDRLFERVPSVPLEIRGAIR